MAVGVALIYAANLLPLELPPPMLAAWIGLPTIMALVIGGWVPHIYRSARRGAIAQRAAACPAASGPVSSTAGGQGPVAMAPGLASR
jgi:hypothetical protein